MASMLQQKLINITTSVAASFYNITDNHTVETLKRDLIPRWFQAASPYLNVSYLQQKWNHMDAQYKQTDTVVGIFKQFLTAVQNSSRYVIRLFNDILPPETRYEQIRHWLPEATLYLIAALVLLFSIRCLLGGKSAVKIMKAPGRPAMMIPRAPFEANPKAYFANLRGKR